MPSERVGELKWPHRDPQNKPVAVPVAWMLEHHVVDFTSSGAFRAGKTRRRRPSDRTRDLRPHEAKRCISDNGWTFGDGFQTVPEQRRLSQGQIEPLMQLYMEGASIDGLARRYGLHRTTVIHHLDEAGITRRRAIRKMTDELFAVDAARYDRARRLRPWPASSAYTSGPWRGSSASGSIDSTPPRLAPLTVTGATAGPPPAPTTADQQPSLRSPQSPEVAGLAELDPAAVEIHLATEVGRRKTFGVDLAASARHGVLRCGGGGSLDEGTGTVKALGARSGEESPCGTLSERHSTRHRGACHPSRDFLRL